MNREPLDGKVIMLVSLGDTSPEYLLEFNQDICIKAGDRIAFLQDAYKSVKVELIRKETNDKEG